MFIANFLLMKNNTALYSGCILCKARPNYVWKYYWTDFFSLYPHHQVTHPQRSPRSATRSPGRWPTPRTSPVCWTRAPSAWPPASAWTATARASARAPATSATWAPGWCRGGSGPSPSCCRLPRPRPSTSWCPTTKPTRCVCCVCPHPSRDGCVTMYRISPVQDSSFPVKESWQHLLSALQRITQLFINWQPWTVSVNVCGLSVGTEKRVCAFLPYPALICSSALCRNLPYRAVTYMTSFIPEAKVNTMLRMHAIRESTETTDSNSSSSRLYS